MTNEELIAKIQAEIERHINELDISDEAIIIEGELSELISFLSDLEKSLPAKVADDKKLEEEYEKSIISSLEKNRVFPELKGDTLHKFKNEFNTIKQIMGGFFNSNNSIQERLAEKFALLFATWGYYNLKLEKSEKQMNPGEERLDF